MPTKRSEPAPEPDVYPGIQPERVVALNERSTADGSYVLYWMQQSQRAEFNHTLEYAIYRANELELPVLAGFGLMDDYPEANTRHYHFMLQGLADVESALASRGITFVVQRGPRTRSRCRWPRRRRWSSATAAISGTSVAGANASRPRRPVRWSRSRATSWSPSSSSRTNGSRPPVRCGPG